MLENKRNAVRTMVEQLALRGVPLAEMRKLLPERDMRVLPGCDADADADAVQGPGRTDVRTGLSGGFGAPSIVEAAPAT